MKRRVVVTGIGAVTPLGPNVDSTWNGVLNGRSGVRAISNFDTGDISSKIAGAVLCGGEDGFNPDEYMTPSEQRKIDKFIAYAIVASDQAVRDAGVGDLSDDQKRRTAVIIGSGIGGVSGLYDSSVNLFTNGARRVSPFFIPSVLINLASGHVAMRHGIRGPNYGIVSACTSGTHSIGEAFRLIRDGYIDYAVTGGAEHAVCKLGVSGFAAAKALSTGFNDYPEKASRPWDKDRDGFVVGEGSGVLVLETFDSAQKRGCKTYGEIIGYGASCDAYHITSPLPDASGAALSMKNAIDDAHIELGEIDYINAHGTSTPHGDIAEIKAIKDVFGHKANNLNISSTKSHMGHLLGAAGAVEAIICLLAMRDGVVPATLNLENPDDGCDLNLTPITPQERKLRYVMSNSFGFGGTNGTLVFKHI
ncbi:MAG: beta-ketoacyl-ACP synthase II [Holosporales bacterium]|nr:beta-ketoacyl-ACP synthase II [Holosporales bacterium]